MEKDELLKYVEQYLLEHPVSEKDFYAVTDYTYDPRDYVNLVSAVLDRWLTEGKLAKQFREAIAKEINTRYSILTNSGSSANLAAVTVAKDLWDDPFKKYVITCATAFPTTVAPIIQNGFIPLFIDIDPNTLTYNYEEIIRQLEGNEVAGIILAHNLGFAYKADIIAAKCRELDKWFIEDTCFVGSTSVYTKDKIKLICDVKVGDELLGFDGISFAPTKVVAVQSRIVPLESIIKIDFGEQKKIHCTENHKFLVGGDWVQAKDLKSGDELWKCDWSEYLNWKRKDRVLSDVGRKILSDRMKVNNPSFNPDTVKRSATNRKKRPSHIEKRVMDVIAKYDLPVKYVGNSKLWIGNTDVGYKNPDFVVSDTNILIEVYDPTFKDRYNKTRDSVWEKYRYDFFALFGYVTKFIPLSGWVNKNQQTKLAETIREIISNGKRIIKVSRCNTKNSRIKRLNQLQDVPNGFVKVYDIKCSPLNTFVITGGIVTHNCDALGTKLDGRPVGSFGDLSTLSFFPAHHITTGEGGSVQTNNAQLYRLLQQYINWGRACFPSGTMISTYSGSMPIEQLYFGYWVKSHTGEYKRISKTFKRQYTGKLYTIKSRTRPSIDVTSEHPFYVYRNGKKEWVCAKDLIVKDILLEAIPKRNEKNKPIYLSYETKYSIKEETLSPGMDLARLLGYWIAEGSLSKELKGSSGYKDNKYFAYRVDFSFNVDEIEYIADVKTLMKKYFGVSGYQRTSHKSNGVSLSFKTRKGFEFFSRFGFKAETKSLPGYVLDWTVDVLSEFLKGFWRGDGSSSWQGFSIATVSNVLIEQIREILLRCGVLCSQWKRKLDVHMSSMVNEKLISSKNELHTLNIYGKNAELFGKIIEESYVARSNKLYSWIDSDYAYYPITSIKVSDVENIDVYNLEVDDDHSYHANGVAVHNCWCDPGKDNTCNKRFDHVWSRKGDDSLSLPDGYDHKYTFTKVGYNLKMTELQAAFGLSQIQKVTEFSYLRRTNYTNLYKITKPYDLYVKPYTLPDGCSPFGFPVLASSEKVRVGFVDYLETHGVRTRPLFSGNIIRHPMMKHVKYEIAQPLVGSETVMNRLFWIGCWPGVTDENISLYEKCLKEYF